VRPRSIPRRVLASPSKFAPRSNVLFQAQQWLSTVLGRTCQLIKQQQRGRIPDARHEKGFHNEGHYLLLSEASIAEAKPIDRDENVTPNMGWDGIGSNEIHHSLSVHSLGGGALGGGIWRRSSAGF
jgi:hypothetical protein